MIGRHAGPVPHIVKPVFIKAPGGSPGTPGLNIIPLAMLMRPDVAT